MPAFTLKNGAGKKQQPQTLLYRPPLRPLTLGEFTPVRGKCYRKGKWKQTNIYNMSDIKHVFSHIALESEPLLLGSLTPTLQTGEICSERLASCEWPDEIHSGVWLESRMYFLIRLEAPEFKPRLGGSVCRGFWRQPVVWDGLFREIKTELFGYFQLA